MPNFSIVSPWIMQLCEYVFSMGFLLYVPKNGVLGGFEGQDVKILSSDPQTALPCVNTRLLMYRVSKSVQWLELYVRGTIFVYEERNKKKLSGKFGYVGRSNPWGDLDQMCRVGRYGGRNHVCNIW